jgi:hypothetical protein
LPGTFLISQAYLVPGFSSFDFLRENIGEKEPVEVLKGFPGNSRFQKIYPGGKGIITVDINELERLEIHLPGRTRELVRWWENSDIPTCTWRGAQVIGDRLRSLPVGSWLDSEKGIFYWQPGPGFLGNYRLEFIGNDRQGNVTAKNVIIKIRPKKINVE